MFARKRTDKETSLSHGYAVPAPSERERKTDSRKGCPYGMCKTMHNPVGAIHESPAEACKIWKALQGMSTGETNQKGPNHPKQDGSALSLLAYAYF